MHDDNTRYIAISRMDNGEKASDLADELGIGKSTLIRWHKEYKSACEAGTLDQLLNVDKLILATAGQLAASPAGMTELIESKVKEMTKGLEGLDRLDAEMQTTALAMNTRIKSLLPSVEHASELECLVDCLCSLRTAFFVKGTQVNVQNNYGSDENTGKYRNLLND